MFDGYNFLVVAVTFGGFQAQPLKKLSSHPYSAFHMSHVAVGAKLSVAGASLIFEGGVNYNWHAFNTSKVLAMAISCSA